MPLTDMQGEVSALAETDVLDKQLQSGQLEKLEMPTVFAIVRESDSDYTTHEEGGQDGNNITAVQNGYRYYNNTVCTKKTCHQETQTNLFTLFTADNAVH